MPIEGGFVSRAPSPAGNAQPDKQGPFLPPARPLGEPQTDRQVAREKKRQKREARSAIGSTQQKARGTAICENCEAFQPTDLRNGLCRLRAPFATVRPLDWCLQFEERATPIAVIPEPAEPEPQRLEAVPEPAEATPLSPTDEVSSLNLGKRATKVLSELDVLVIGELTRLNRAQILAVKGAGAGVIQEIESALEANGYALAE